MAFGSRTINGIYLLFVGGILALDDRFHETRVLQQAELMERTGCWRIPRLRSAKRGAVSWQDGGERSNWQ